MAEILIIDDQKESRTLIKSLLSASNFSFTFSEADNKGSALEIIRQKKLDCIILDYALGGMNGLDILHHIKSAQPDLPVMMVSAYDHVSIEKKVFSAGANAFLPRSKFSPEALSKALIKVSTVENTGINPYGFKGLAGMKVLIVDDTPQNIKILRYVLEDQGLIVSLAPNGEVALKIISKDKPDLILLDVVMPIMGGFETCQKLKENDAWKNIPVIFISALTSQSDFEKAFSLGAADYIPKPFRYEEVKTKVLNHLLIRGLSKENETLVKKIRKKDIDHGELKRSNDELEKFASIASHDLQEPLREIVLLCTRMKENVSMEEKRFEYIEKVRTATCRMQKYIERLLETSKIKTEQESKKQAMSVFDKSDNVSKTSAKRQQGFRQDL